MAKGKSLIQNLADNNISFDFITNEKGNNAYENEFISIDSENADEYAKTGNFSGVTIYNFTPDEIPNFDKVSSDIKFWTYSLPVLEITISDMSEKQMLSLLGIIGKELKSLKLNYSKLDKLELDKILKVCPNLCNLELYDQNWNREERLPVDLNKLGKQKFDSVLCREFHLSDDANWSALNIDSLNLDECDTSRIVFPNKLKNLECTATNESVIFKGAQNLKKLVVTLNHENVKCADLKSFTNLTDLELNVFFGKGVDIKLPNSLINLTAMSGESTKCSLSFLNGLKNLNSLTIKSADKGFIGYDAIQSLAQLKIFNFDENGVGNTAFKSDFKTAYLCKMNQLEEIKLRRVVNLSDFIFVKELNNLRVLEIDTSRVKTLKGLESSNITSLYLIDCHGISDLTPILKSKVVDFKFRISNLWATKVEMTVQTLNQLADSNIQYGEILMNKTKFAKKDLKTLEKVFNLEVEYESLNLTRKK